MGIQMIMGKVCAGLYGIPMKVLCLLIVVLQAFFIDAMLVTWYGDGDFTTVGKRCEACFWWIAADVIVLGMFIASFIISWKHLKHFAIFKRMEKSHITIVLPLSCITWFVYSSLLAARVGVIFWSNIDNAVTAKDFFGPQFLKTGIALSAVVFILFVASHHTPKESKPQKLYINSMASGVTFDLLDTVDFLDVLFVSESKVVLPFKLQNAIITIAVINLVRPTFSFLVLFLKHFNERVLPRELSAANALVYIFFVNIPFLVIRMYLWHNLEQDMSVFLIKNFIMIFLGIYELYEIGVERQEETDGKVVEVELSLREKNTGESSDPHHVTADESV